MKNMDILDTVALKNLIVLSKHVPDEDEDEVVGMKEWYVDGPILKLSTEDDYDRGSITLKLLEYPLVFTFERLFVFLGDTQRISFGRYSRRDVLRLMDYSLETCHHIFKTLPYDDASNRITYYLQEADDRHSMYHEKVHSIDRSCWHMFENMFDDFVELLASSGKYLYITPMKDFIDPDSDSDSYSNSESESESDGGNKSD